MFRDASFQRRHGCGSANGSGLLHPGGFNVGAGVSGGARGGMTGSGSGRDRSANAWVDRWYAHRPHPSDSRPHHRGRRVGDAVSVAARAPVVAPRVALPQAERADGGQDRADDDRHVARMVDARDVVAPQREPVPVVTRQIDAARGATHDAGVDVPPLLRVDQGAGAAPDADEGMTEHRHGRDATDCNDGVTAQLRRSSSNGSAPLPARAGGRAPPAPAAAASRPSRS